MGFAELLRESEGERLSERGRRYVGTIAEAAETAGRLVDALLNFSQMGRTALVPVGLDPTALVLEVRRALAPEQAGRHVEWRVAPMPTVSADPTMLRQVFQNLLSNAIKYSRGRNPAVIEVDCEATDGEFVFSVRDNGAGFDMTYAHKLFGVFQRLHRAEEFEGVGIGLANVQRIVERHGGRIWAEGRLGEGAAFHSRSRGMMRSGRRHSDMAQLRPVLLVEDSPNDVELHTGRVGAEAAWPTRWWSRVTASKRWTFCFAAAMHQRGRSRSICLRWSCWTSSYLGWTALRCWNR
ncbi:sensor histidine kinase [Dankookia sp. P2]|uniref:sensor histidine kinase n=1 Tax=Dankookia sp. P2 TaxID=3423955 RepID=UPI003D679563